MSLCDKASKLLLAATSNIYYPFLFLVFFQIFEELNPAYAVV